MKPICNFILAAGLLAPVLPAQPAPPAAFHFNPADPLEGVPDNAPKPPFVSSARRLLTAPELADAPDEWIGNSFQWVNFILEHFRPSLDEHPVRRAALIRLDDVLHIESAPKKSIVQEFYRQRLDLALAEIESTRVTEGIRIWKLYNHGFVVRSATATVAFDIVPGTRTPGFAVNPEWLSRLAAQCDALFISHWHGDHASQDSARAFLAAGKPVVAPEGLWSDIPEFARALTYPARETGPARPIALSGGRSIQLVAYPGHQGPKVLVNLHLVTFPEGFTVLQTGDQSGTEAAGGDFDWITQIGRDHKVDILMPNCWANGLGRMVRGVNPALVVTGHENEMGHTVNHREDYTQTYNRLYPIRYPSVLMTWGESFHYRRAVR